MAAVPAVEGSAGSALACCAKLGVRVLCGCWGGAGGSLGVGPAGPEQVGDGPAASPALMALTSVSASSFSCVNRLSCWATELRLLWEERTPLRVKTKQGSQGASRDAGSVTGHCGLV